MITGFLTEFAMPESRNGFCAICLAFLLSFVCSGGFGATNTGGCIKSERIAIANSACVFAADIVGTETIAEGRSGKRLCLPAGCASGQQHRAAFKWIGTGRKSSRYVAAELKALGCDVQLEKVMVPHWVRGEETAALVQFPGQAPNTTQKIVLCALGGSVATPKNGIEAEVLVVKNFDELKSMPREKVAGKIVLFNYPFDKQMAAEGRSFPSLWQSGCLSQ